jgi:hypothetical protein
MPKIINMTIQKQAGNVSCWVAAARCVLDHYGTSDGLTQGDLVKAYHKGKPSGDTQWILDSVGAHRKTEHSKADEAALKTVPLTFLRIKDSINRLDPIVVDVDLAGGGNMGHALVAYGYDDSDDKRNILLLDPARPNNHIVVDIVDLMHNCFSPYADVYVNHRYYARRLIFSQRPRILAAWGMKDALNRPNLHGALP